MVMANKEVAPLKSCLVFLSLSSHVQSLHSLISPLHLPKPYQHQEPGSDVQETVIAKVRTHTLHTTPLDCTIVYHTESIYWQL